MDFPVAPTASPETWPWRVPSLPVTEASSLPDSTPRITVVTPSFNQAQFIEETIRSVLLQGYPNFEYIVIDGGSTDGSVEIIRRYEKWLAHWESEKDRGQSHAINKGFARASGEILAWLNSDDFLLPGTLAAVGEAFRSNREAGLVYGGCRNVDSEGRTAGADAKVTAFSMPELLLGNFIPQPSAFFRRTVFEKTGPLDEELHMVMDYDLWIRIASAFPVIALPQVLSVFRTHLQQKTYTASLQWAEEMIRVYCDRVPASLRENPALESARRRSLSYMLRRRASFRWKQRSVAGAVGDVVRSLTVR